METEGLTLQPSEHAAGFKGVTFKSGKVRPYHAQMSRGGRQLHLGRFATAEEAALCYARDIAANGEPGPTGLTKAQSAAAAEPALT